MPTTPPHATDASIFVTHCSDCKRLGTEDQYGQMCEMRQPDGSRCLGRFEFRDGETDYEHPRVAVFRRIIEHVDSITLLAEIAVHVGIPHDEAVNLTRGELTQKILERFNAAGPSMTSPPPVEHRHASPPNLDRQRADRRQSPSQNTLVILREIAEILRRIEAKLDQR